MEYKEDEGGGVQGREGGKGREKRIRRLYIMFNNVTITHATILHDIEKISLVNRIWNSENVMVSCSWRRIRKRRRRKTMGDMHAGLMSWHKTVVSFEPLAYFLVRSTFCRHRPVIT